MALEGNKIKKIEVKKYLTFNLIFFMNYRQLQSQNKLNKNNLHLYKKLRKNIIWKYKTRK